MTDTRHANSNHDLHEDELEETYDEQPHGERGGDGGGDGDDPGATLPHTGDEVGEVDILRGELAQLHGDLATAQQQAGDFKDRYLRTQAELQNYRRRVAQDLDRARDAGLDSAVLAVLPVYDDLARALEMAESDPGQIVPGVKAVREGLSRNLETLGIVRIGARGDTFDPDLHEALTSVPTDEASQAGTIAEVYQVGFVKEGRLVRPARVVVYQA